MLSKLKQFFSRNNPSKKISDNPNFITRRADISHLLKTLQHQNLVCLMDTPLSDEIYNTKIIEVHTQTIVIKELIPALGNSLLTYNQPLKILADINNIHSSIILEGLTPEYRDGKLFYNTELPQRIYYPQRRVLPRFNPLSEPVKFIGHSERTHCSASGLVINISEQGLALIINIPLASLRKGDVLKKCTVMFPSEQSIHFNFNVRHINDYSHNKLIIGGDMNTIEDTPIKKIKTEQAYLQAFIQQLSK